MAKVFDFSEIEKSEATIQRTWDEFRKALTKKLSLIMTYKAL